MDVAVVGTGGLHNEGFLGIVNQLNDDTYFDFNATLVTSSQVDTVEKLNQYDAVVIGDSGDARDEPLTNAAFMSALKNWVQSGGGVVMTGWGIFGAGIEATGGPALPDIDAIIPVNTTGFDGHAQGGTLNVTDGNHPVTNGVADFTVGSNDFIEYPREDFPPQVDPGATVLGKVSGQPTVVVGNEGLGRGVYLGPIYANAVSSLDTTELRTGSADRLLEQAVNWVAASGIQGLSASPTFENGLTTLSGSIDASFPGDSFTLDINWGDPLSPVNTQTVALGTSAINSDGITWNPATRQFSVTHQYLDDNPSATTSDVYSIHVSLTNSDGVFGGTKQTTASVANVAPTLSNLATVAIQENGTTTLTGKIADVGTLDTFTVVIDWANGTQTISNVSAGNFSYSHQYLDDNAADSYPISVTVTDDDGGSVVGTTSVTVTNVAPTTGISSVPATAVPGQSISLAGVFSDIGTLDTHSAMIDWGDSSSSTATVSESRHTIAGSHVYSSLGTYNVTLTVTDDDGGSSTATATIKIQPGVVPDTDPCGDGGMALIVGGTNSADKIEVKLGSANHPGKYTVNITTNGVLSTTSGDTGTPTSRVIVYGLDGNDDISVDTHGRTIPAWLFGGNGDDKLTGNIGNDVLDGGGGNDTLTGNGGRDLLIGGQNTDLLNASKGDDILIGGSLNYADYQKALCQIMDEWTSSHDFLTRRTVILDSSPTGINLLAHVAPDGATDTLNGGSGSDWFIANTNTTTGSTDFTLDKLGGVNLSVDFITDV